MERENALVIRWCQIANALIQRSGLTYLLEPFDSSVRTRFHAEPSVPNFVPSGGLCWFVSVRNSEARTLMNTGESNPAQVALND